jgi:hypothetical protein
MLAGACSEQLLMKQSVTCPTAVFPSRLPINLAYLELSFLHWVKVIYGTNGMIYDVSYMHAY